MTTTKLFRTCACLFIAFALPATWVGQVSAGAWECTYNGKPHDTRFGREPKNFTGEKVCVDGSTGKRVKLETYKGGEREGAYKEWNPRTGQLTETATYRNGKREGALRRFRNGTVYLEYRYVRGETRGLQQAFDEGKLKRLYFIDDSGKATGELNFTPEGKLSSFKCGQRPINEAHGRACGFGGKQSETETFARGGKRRAVAGMLDGQRHGTYQRFHLGTGRVLEEARYERGQRVGERKHWSPDGTLLSTSTCDPRRTDCQESEYFEAGGQLARATRFRDGQILWRRDYYQNGKQKRRVKQQGDHYFVCHHFDTGRVRSKGLYLPRGRDSYTPDGVVETFDESGKPTAKETYVRGRRQGPSDYHWSDKGRRYHEQAKYENGRRVSRTVYLDGQRVAHDEFMPDGSTKNSWRAPDAPERLRR